MCMGFLYRRDVYRLLHICLTSLLPIFTLPYSSPLFPLTLLPFLYDHSIFFLFLLMHIVNNFDITMVHWVYLDIYWIHMWYFYWEKIIYKTRERKKNNNGLYIQEAIVLVWCWWRCAEMNIANNTFLFGQLILLRSTTTTKNVKDYKLQNEEEIVEPIKAITNDFWKNLR